MALPERSTLFAVPAGPAEVAREARSDDELMLLARGGQRDAFDTLVRRHQARALNVASKLLGSPSLARDAAQAAFVELFRAVPGYRPRGSFSAYLSRVVLNQCRMAARQRGTERRHLEALAVEPRAAVVAPDEQLLARERQRDVQRALSGLSERLRTVVVLRFAGELSLAEVAEVLELPVGTVKSRLFAGLSKLRESLEETP